MPFYDYECKDCNKRITKQKTMADRDKFPDCPECKKPMKRPLAAVPTHYKTDGFTGARKMH